MVSDIIKFNIEGATFTLRRVYDRRHSPTKRFELDNTVEFVDNDYRKEAVEIGWSVPDSRVADILEKKGVKYTPRSSLFKIGAEMIFEEII